jgi:hypothetical protein
MPFHINALLKWNYHFVYVKSSASCAVIKSFYETIYCSGMIVVEFKEVMCRNYFTP